MNNVNIPVAFLAGLLSFLSPCILPLIPGYISFITGETLESLGSEEAGPGMRRRTMLSSLSFVAGFSIVFVMLGATATFLGSFLARYEGLLNRVAGVVIIILGLHLSGILRIRWMYRQKKLEIKRTRIGFFEAFLLGAAFALGWTPCVGPILAGILTLAATEASLLRGMMLLLVYSLGIGIPFLLTALAVEEFVKAFKRWSRWIRWTELVAGAVLIIVGILIFTGDITRLMRFVPEYFYNFAR